MPYCQFATTLGLRHIWGDGWIPEAWESDGSGKRPSPILLDISVNVLRRLSVAEFLLHGMSSEHSDLSHTLAGKESLHH